MSHSFSSRPTVIFQPSRVTIQAVVTACAMIDRVDGHVANKERRSSLRFLHHHGVLKRYGRAPNIAAFKTAVRHASLLTLDEICSAAYQFSAALMCVQTPPIRRRPSHSLA